MPPQGPQTLQQTLAAVESLNKPEQPFSYRIEGNQIIGEWKYLDATWAAPLAAGNIDKEFKVVISFDEVARTFTYKDQQSQSKSGFSLNPLSGDISLGKSSEGFSGHKAGKEFGFSFGKAKQPQNQTPVGGPTYQYKFDTSELKEPLFNFLNQNGWQKGKSGIFGKLFGSK